MEDPAESRDTRFFGSLNGPLLNEPTIARDFATMLLRRLHGDAELAKQQPLSVVDQGGDWVVMGSHQEHGMRQGTGAWFVRVRKSDCRVQKFGHFEPVGVPEAGGAANGPGKV
jgi:hypothetical protein